MIAVSSGKPPQTWVPSSDKLTTRIIWFLCGSRDAAWEPPCQEALLQGSAAARTNGTLLMYSRLLSQPLSGFSLHFPCEVLCVGDWNNQLLQRDQADWFNTSHPTQGGLDLLPHPAGDPFRLLWIWRVIPFSLTLSVSSELDYSAVNTRATKIFQWGWPEIEYSLW